MSRIFISFQTVAKYFSRMHTARSSKTFFCIFTVQTTLCSVKANYVPLVLILKPVATYSQRWISPNDTWFKKEIIAPLITQDYTIIYIFLTSLGFANLNDILKNSVYFYFNEFSTKGSLFWIYKLSIKVSNILTIIFFFTYHPLIWFFIMA